MAKAKPKVHTSKFRIPGSDSNIDNPPDTLRGQLPGQWEESVGRTEFKSDPPRKGDNSPFNFALNIKSGKKGG